MEVVDPGNVMMETLRLEARRRVLGYFGGATLSQNHWHPAPATSTTPRVQHHCYTALSHNNTTSVTCANTKMGTVSDSHVRTMRHCLNLARKSPPKPTNFRVGAVIVRLSDNEVIAEGYTLQLPGNTHAEQCCLLKLAEQHSVSEEQLASSITEPHALYTTVEPCFKRLSGNLPCVERVIRQKSWIKKVYVGVTEPETFVGQNPGRKMLEDSGIEVIHVEGLGDEILQVATAGHIKDE